MTTQKQTNSAGSLEKDKDHKRDTKVVNQTVCSKRGHYKLPKRLEDMPYYHGVLPREEINQLLLENGDYLVRLSKLKGATQFVVSVLAESSPKHFPIHIDARGRFRFEGNGYATIPDLIDHYVKSGEPLTKTTGALLKRAVPKEKWELNNDEIIKDVMIGEGHFAKVWKGKCKDPESHEMTEVAIKICRSELTDEEKKKFILEARIMRRYDHPNIVRLLGIAAQKEPLMIVIELMLGGSLETYLQQNKVDPSEKLQYCFDASKGMEYLAQKKCIHRDLAARNCLLQKDKLLKIGDFGMSRETDEYVLSIESHLPIKWTALEVLFRKTFTLKSDIWSFGILIWEIYMDGAVPYPGMNNLEAVHFLRKGNRLKGPECMSKEIEETMLSCWDILPEKRPTIQKLKSIFEKLISSNK